MNSKTQIERKEAIANYYENNDKYDSNNSNDEEINRNLRPSEKICENPCYKFDSTSDYGSINRYMLSGDLLAGKITKTIKLDNSTVTKKEWYHLDHLNSTKATTDEFGKMSTMYEYRAFGEELKKLGSGDAKYTYGGKELDDETNLYYFNARYYDATIGRFINVDPIQDGLNWYVYCNNNPMNRADITGLLDPAQLRQGVFQVAGGAAEIYAAATTTGFSRGAVAPAAAVYFIDGMRNVGEGLIKMIAATQDIKWTGVISETAAEVYKATGASNEKVNSLKNNIANIEAVLDTALVPTKPASAGFLLTTISSDLDKIQESNRNRELKLQEIENNKSDYDWSKVDMKKVRQEYNQWINNQPEIKNQAEIRKQE
ncbi:MAG TPA: RHS repeat-associated core domain-containing protein [Spirochaetota bacterium]|nr:RHS repeat-associated core domain-containing protein [Spirochaetota bacterium]